MRIPIKPFTVLAAAVWVSVVFAIGQWTDAPSAPNASVPVDKLPSSHCSSNKLGTEECLVTDSVPTCKSTNNSKLHESEERRDVEARQAEKLLMDVNFYSEGKGLVFPFLMTKANFLKLGAETIEGEFGLILSESENQAIGISEESVDRDKILVVGCAACHVGKAAGEVIPGLGSKTIDSHQISKSNKYGLRIANALDQVRHPFDRERADFIKKSMKMANVFQDPIYDAKVKGLMAPMSAISKSLEAIDHKNPPAFPAPTKIPHVWGYEPKRKVGAFYDGFVLGDPPGPSGLSMFLGNYDRQTYEAMIPKMEMVEVAFGKLLPPDYPFDIADEMVSEGHLIYQANCQECHGQHDRDQEGFPVDTAPKFIPIDEIGTDSYRTDIIEAYRSEYSQSLAESWLGQYVVDGQSEAGYFSPKLWGIWSRFPYLHNGSVPTIYDLLSEPHSRPTSFSLKRAGEKERFDQDKVGLTKILTPNSKPSAIDRNVFDTKKAKGLLNDGHDFGTRLNEKDKRALIEYLKTL